MKYNNSQTAAIEQGQGPTLVLAGPGSGENGRYYTKDETSNRKGSKSS